MNAPAALRVLRAARGISQVDLAPLVGCTPQYLHMLEAGERHPSKGMLARLLAAYEISDTVWAVLMCGPDDAIASIRVLTALTLRPDP